MTEWDDRFADAAIWNHLDRLEGKLSDAADLAKEAGDEKGLTAVERLQAVRSYVETALNNVDPFLTSRPTLNKLADVARNAEQHLDSYLESGDASHLAPSGSEKNAAFYGDRMLVFVRQLPGLDPVHEVEEIQETVSSFRYSAAQFMRRVKEDAKEALSETEQVIEEANTKLQKYDDELTARLTTVKEEAEETQKTIQTRTEERLQSLEQQIDSQKQRISDALERFTTDFDSSQTERTNTFNKQLDEWEKEYKTSLKKHVSQAEKYLSDMEDDRNEVEKLMGVIGASGRAKGFEKQANYERWSSYGWRFLTVIAMGVLVAAAWWLAQEAVTPTSGLDWPSIVAKFTLLGAIGVFATYSGRQGRKHRQRAKINRQLQLELTSINPYLAGFPEEKQQEIKERMVDRWFGNLPSFSDADDKNQSLVSMQEIKRLIMDAVKRGATDT